MSVITFTCNEENKNEVLTLAWEIIKNHYYMSAHPNTNVKYDNEGKDVYLSRLEELMREELCTVEDTDEGFSIIFDTTEDAGESIASSVYGTDMGYSDNGLTYLISLFKEISVKVPASFEAHAECYDSWVSEEYDATYDGETLKVKGIDADAYERIFSLLGEGKDLECIAEETGIPFDDLCELIEY